MAAVEASGISKGLSIVIPFYNELENAKKSVEAIQKASKHVSFPVEIIVVDDGSTEKSSLADFPPTVRFFRNRHLGKTATRLDGVRHAHHSNVLLVDSRVWIEELSLKNLEEECQNYPEAIFWNGYINILHTDNPFVSIWETLVALGWGRGLNLEKTVNFNAEKFDYFPKGTSIFLAPKEDWIRELTKLLNKSTNKNSPISDDTPMLREFASRSDIWISPNFSANYMPRTKFRPFISNALLRGKVFVDSYWLSKSLIGKATRSLPLGIVALMAILTLSFGYLFAIMFLAFLYLFLLIGLFSYSLMRWKAFRRSILETFVFTPMILVFGSGFLLAYLSKLKTYLRLRES